MKSVIAIAGLVAAGAAPSATPLKRTPLLDQALPAAVQVHHIKGGRVAFLPGQPTGRHLHQAPVIGFVTEGSFVFQLHGQALRVLKTGDAFYEPANTVIERFDNASKTAPAAISAYYLLARADEPAITMLPK